MIWNIIDRRSKRHRWARINAIVEATWHDNSVSGADQAPESAIENDVTFEERKDISVNDAISWASALSASVTLYLSDDETIQPSSNKEVDAAARILDGYGRRNGWWAPAGPAFDDMKPAKKQDFRFIVEGMLHAAATVRSEAST